MARRREHGQLVNQMQEYEEDIGVCCAIATTLIEIGKPVLSNFFSPSTDFEMARQQILVSVSQLLGLVHEAKAIRLHQDLIRTEVLLEGIQECCRRCRNLNRYRFANGEEFLCCAGQLIHSGQQESNTANGFRYQLTHGGRIIEQS